MSKQTPIQFLLNPSHEAKTYGYVAMSKSVDDMLKIIPEFNTFAEIIDDLKLFNPDLWQVCLFKSDLKKDLDVVYKVVGNGFLELAS